MNELHLYMFAEMRAGQMHDYRTFSTESEARAYLQQQLEEAHAPASNIIPGVYMIRDEKDNKRILSMWQTVEILQ